MKTFNQAVSIVTVWLCITILIFFTQKVFADSFKCGRTWVNTGDSVATIRNKCGRPNWKDTTSSRGSKVKRESWNYPYNRSGNGTLNFKNGKLISVETQIR